MVGLSSEAGISKRAMHTFHYDTFCVEGSVSSRGRGGSTILDLTLHLHLFGPNTSNEL